MTSDTRALIDHLVSNKPHRISSGGVISCGISDHDAVIVVRISAGACEYPNCLETQELGSSQRIQKFSSLIAIEQLNNLIRRTSFVKYLGLIIDVLRHANRQHIQKGEKKYWRD